MNTKTTITQTVILNLQEILGRADGFCAASRIQDQCRLLVEQPPEAFIHLHTDNNDDTPGHLTDAGLAMTTLDTTWDNLTLHNIFNSASIRPLPRPHLAHIFYAMCSIVICV